MNTTTKITNLRARQLDQRAQARRCCCLSTMWLPVHTGATAAARRRHVPKDGGDHELRCCTQAVHVVQLFHDLRICARTPELKMLRREVRASQACIVFLQCRACDADVLGVIVPPAAHVMQ